MKSNICPICGYEGLQILEKEKTIKYPYGGQEIIKIKEYYCPDCDIAGDFYYENDDNTTMALDKLKNKSINNIIGYFNKNKVSMTALERILSIPFRTLSRWKNNSSKPSSSAIALFKFLRTYPWLLEVAENNFDEEFSKNILIYSTFKVCSEINNFSSAGTFSTNDSHILYMQFDHNKPKHLDNNYNEMQTMTS